MSAGSADMKPMDDNVIRVGDDVIIAYPMSCCGHSEYVGKTFRVTDIVLITEQLQCMACKELIDTPADFACGAGMAYVELRRLQKIRRFGISVSATTKTNQKKSEPANV